MAFGFAAYGIWGLFPLYWPLLEPAGAGEILAHRLLWSLVVMGVLVVALRRWSRLRALLADRRRMRILPLAAVAVSLNWLIYIGAVNSGHVVEASLGYFVNPLVTVLFGVLLLGERLRPMQWAALGVAALAVVVLTLDLGRPPWIALGLALSFGSYGLLKKRADAGAIESLTVETAVVAPIALAYVAWLGALGRGHFVGEGPTLTTLLIGSGVVTVVPLLCFGAAATRIPLTMLGLLQYLTPIAQFLLGVLYFHEYMPPGRWAGFALVWVALVAFTVEALTHARREQLRRAAESAAI